MLSLDVKTKIYISMVDLMGSVADISHGDCAVCVRFRGKGEFAKIDICLERVSVQFRYQIGGRGNL